MAPLFLLDNIVEILTATGVFDGQTGFPVLPGLNLRLFHFMG
jgi:hypothetical protein